MSHLVLGDAAVNAVYDIYGLEPRLRSLCDRLLCLQDAPDPEQSKLLRKNCKEYSDADFTYCLLAMSMVRHDVNKAIASKPKFEL